jgi:hypothetical protein
MPSAFAGHLFAAVHESGIAIEDTILNYFIRHADPLVIQQHFDASESGPVMRRTAIRFVAAARLSKVIL